MKNHDFFKVFEFRKIFSYRNRTSIYDVTANEAGWKVLWDCFHLRFFKYLLVKMFYVVQHFCLKMKLKSLNSISINFFYLWRLFPKKDRPFCIFRLFLGVFRNWCHGLWMGERGVNDFVTTLLNKALKRDDGGGHVKKMFKIGWRHLWTTPNFFWGTVCTQIISEIVPSSEYPRNHKKKKKSFSLALITFENGDVAHLIRI